MNCPYCGRRMKGDWPDKSRWFNCDHCRDRFFLEDDGELVNALNRGSKSAQTCEACGEKMAGAKYIPPWTNGNNSNGYIKCPRCGHVNFILDD